MTSLIAFTLRIALLALFTFLFVVLFEHGPADFVSGLRSEFGEFIRFTTEFSSPSAEKSPDSGT